MQGEPGMNARKLWMQGIGWGVVVLLALFFIWPRNRVLHDEQGIHSLEEARVEWSKGQLLSEEVLSQFSQHVALNPALHGRYDGLLAQAYLLHPNAVRSIEYLNRIQNRLEDRISTLHKRFLATTIFIAQNAYEDAYQGAKQLEEELHAQDTCPWLRLMNLLRLTALTYELHHVEHGYWASRLQMHPYYSQLATLFQDGSWHWNPNQEPKTDS